MKIYLAGRYSRRDELLKHALDLQLAGHSYTSQWLDGGEEGKTSEDIAKMDFDDVVRADMTLVFTDEYGSSQTGGGRHTELGIAYALKKRVWIVGDREQVFHSLPGVVQFYDVQEVIRALSILETPEYMKHNNQRQYSPGEIIRASPIKDLWVGGLRSNA